MMARVEETAVLGHAVGNVGLGAVGGRAGLGCWLAQGDSLENKMCNVIDG